MIKILYFAWLREKTGVKAEELDHLPADITTVAQLIGWLVHRSPGHADAFANAATIRCAVNQEFATPGTPLTGATEIAFFPPVTGG